MSLSLPTIMRHVLASSALVLAIGCGGGPPPQPQPVAPPPPPAAATPAPAAAPAPKPQPPPPPAADAAALIDDGEQAAADGDLSTAETAFRQAIRADAKMAEGHYNLGVLAEWQGRYDDARGRYEDALSAQAEFAPAVIASGRLLLRRGQVDAALRFARERLGRSPDSVDLRNALNRLRLDAGRETEAVESDSKAVLRKDEKNVDAMINLALAYHAKGRFELAVAILDNAKALTPENPEIFFRKALAHEALDESIKARVALEEAARLPGGATAEIYNNLGLLYHAAGDYIGAETQFRKALARWPDMLSARINLGNALKGQQRFADADAALKGALGQASDDPDVLYNLGILYLDGQLPDVAAIDRLERALAFFARYKQTSGARATNDPVDAYIEEAKKRLEVERKRQAQMRKAPKAPPPEPDGGPGDGDEDEK